MYAARFLAPVLLGVGLAVPYVCPNAGFSQDGGCRGCNVSAPAGPSQALLNQAILKDSEESPDAADLYFDAAASAWKALEEQAPNGADAVAGSQAVAVYREAIFGLVRTGIRSGKLSVVGGKLQIRDQSIPVRFVGFSWVPADFQKIYPACNYRHKDLSNHYAYAGVGASFLAVRQGQPGDRFFPTMNPIAATALVRPAPGPRKPKEATPFVLEFVNPYPLPTTEVAGVEVPMDRDLSAPFAFFLQEAPKNYFAGFVNPSEPNVKPSLLMLEPHRRGKIPVVFAHGLYSQPTTWLDAVNELKSKPEFYRRYQIWGFRYPTGGAFLESATAYRLQFAAAIADANAEKRDPAADHAVLIGHSMGGLISKFLITSSCEILWNRFSRVPFDEIRTTPEFRHKLAEAFFFEPSPHVSRMIYIASPHGGSPMANRPIAVISKRLVRYTGEQDTEWRQFVDDNFDLLQPYFRRSTRPTTIDLLKPNNMMLTAIGELPVNPRVRSHTIIGEGHFFPAMRRGDGIVPIASARIADAVSETFVRAKHTMIHRTPEAIGEVRRILEDHYSEYQATGGVAGGASAAAPSQEALEARK